MALTAVSTRLRNGQAHLSISQSAAAAAEEWIAAPSAGYRIVITELVVGISADGTAVFLSAANALSGAIPVTAAGGFARRGTLRNPVFECNAAEAFNVTSVSGALRGFLKYKVVAGT